VCISAEKLLKFQERRSIRAAVSFSMYDGEDVFIVDN
jgi:hypothetical protein